MNKQHADAYTYVTKACFDLTLGTRSYEKYRDRSILGLARKVLPDVEFTEQYIYEEVIFCIELVREADLKYDFITNMGRFVYRDMSIPLTSDNFSPDDIVSLMFGSGYTISTTIMSFMNIYPEKSEQSFSEFWQERITSYEQLYQENLSFSEPIEYTDMALGFEPRSHPLSRYLGSVSDNLSISLGADSEELRSYYCTMLAPFIMTRYTTFLKVAANLGPVD